MQVSHQKGILEKPVLGETPAFADFSSFIFAPQQKITNFTASDPRHDMSRRVFGHIP